MISIIYGGKGSGKTVQLINWANSAVESSEGQVVYITDTKDYSPRIDFKIKYVACDDYDVNSPEEMVAFIRGMIAANGDIKTIYIDGIKRITKVQLDEMGKMFEAFEQLSCKEKPEEQYNVDMVFAVSIDLEHMPDFIKKHVK